MNLHKVKDSRTAKGNLGRAILDTFFPERAAETATISDSEAFKIGCSLLKGYNTYKKVTDSNKVIDARPFGSLYTLMKQTGSTSSKIVDWFVDAYCEHPNNSALLNAFKDYLIDTYAIEPSHEPNESWKDFMSTNGLTNQSIFSDLEDFLRNKNILDDFASEYIESIGMTEDDFTLGYEDENGDVVDSAGNIVDCEASKYKSRRVSDNFSLQNSTDLYSLLTNTPPISKDIVIELFVRNVDVDSLNNFHQSLAQQLNLPFDPNQKFADFCYKNSGTADTSHIFEYLNSWLSDVDKQKLINHIIEVYTPDNKL